MLLFRSPVELSGQHAKPRQRPTPDAAASLGLESVGHGLLERHLSTDSEGNGEALLAELGYERASRLFTQALLIGQRGVSGFLT
jgi:hypothetical protein